MNVNGILNYLNTARGLDLSGYRASMVNRRVMQRCSATGSTDPEAYLHYLQAHPEELDRLVDALTINVSRFFRNALLFEYLARKILPCCLQDKARLKAHFFRVWSAGCALGEEPYSIALLIKEILRKEEHPVDVALFATDIDEGALKRARAAVYPVQSIKNVKYGLLRRYFHPVHADTGDPDAEPRQFQLTQEIREAVRFSVYDMQDSHTYAPPESVFGSFDMVLCRNLLIYFDLDHQERIMTKLYRSLNPGGYLVLGQAEVPPAKYRNLLNQVDACCHVYQKR